MQFPSFHHREQVQHLNPCQTQSAVHLFLLYGSRAVPHYPNHGKIALPASSTGVPIPNTPNYPNYFHNYNYLGTAQSESAGPEDTASLIKKFPKFGDKKTTKSGLIFYLKAGTHQQEIKQRAAFAVESESQIVFMHQEGLGLLRMGSGAQGQMVGQVYQHKNDYKSGEQVTMLHLNGKLYVRAESIKPKPFVRVDPATLEEDEKEEFELDKEDKNLEWKTNEETGRSLTYTPLFSDGSNIYVVSQRKTPKPKGKLFLPT